MPFDINNSGKGIAMNRAWIKIFLILALNSCDSADLGDEDALTVAVDTADPTWSNGIGALMQAKCANCHSSNRSKFVPKNVPSDSTRSINNIANESFFDGSSAKKTGLAYSVTLKVFHDSLFPMPTKFATPLSSDERAALELFLKNKGFGMDTICPTKETTLTWADTEPIIKEKCAYAGCHGATSIAIYPLDTLERVKLYRSKSLAYIVSAYMPQGSETGFLASEKGSKLRDWLCAGAEF
jgi:hypothetical protein